MGKKVPLTIYNSQGMRTVIGVADVDDDGSIMMSLNREFRHIIQQDCVDGEFSFAFYPGVPNPMEMKYQEEPLHRIPIDPPEEMLERIHQNLNNLDS